MLYGIINLFRLARAGAILLWHGVQSGRRRHERARAPPVPWAADGHLRARRRAEGTILAAFERAGRARSQLYQARPVLATRRDVIGAELANDLAKLQDRLPAFPMSGARQAIRDGLGAEPERLFETLSEPIAAASIAQVHKATVREADGSSRKVAVKILRPGVEKRFRHDLDSFYFARRKIEAWHPPSRRLAADCRGRYARRLGATRDGSAAGRGGHVGMAENICPRPPIRFSRDESGLDRTSARVMTTNGEGHPISDSPQSTSPG